MNRAWMQKAWMLRVKTGQWTPPRQLTTIDISDLRNFFFFSVNSLLVARINDSFHLFATRLSNVRVFPLHKAKRRFMLYIFYANVIQREQIFEQLWE